MPLLKKKKKDALKYTETPELESHTDGNPGGITEKAEIPIPEPPSPTSDTPPGKRPLTDLEVNGYFGSSVIVLLQQLTELQRQTVAVLTELKEEQEEENGGV